MFCFLKILPPLLAVVVRVAGDPPALLGECDPYVALILPPIKISPFWWCQQGHHCENLIQPEGIPSLLGMWKKIVSSPPCWEIFLSPSSIFKKSVLIENKNRMLTIWMEVEGSIMWKRHMARVCQTGEKTSVWNQPVISQVGARRGSFQHLCKMFVICVLALHKLSLQRAVSHPINHQTWISLIFSFPQ